MSRSYGSRSRTGGDWTDDPDIWPSDEADFDDESDEEEECPHDR
jgi:hypothetical protein